jgi:hypothetical protein
VFTSGFFFTLNLLGYGAAVVGVVEGWLETISMYSATHDLFSILFMPFMAAYCLLVIYLTGVSFFSAIQALCLGDLRYIHWARKALHIYSGLAILNPFFVIVTLPLVGLDLLILNLALKGPSRLANSVMHSNYSYHITKSRRARLLAGSGWLAVPSCAVMIILTLAFAFPSPKRPLVVDFGPHRFSVPPRYAYTRSSGGGAPQTAIGFTAFLPDLSPPVRSDFHDRLMRPRDAIPVLVNYNGPSYSGRAIVQLFTRISGQRPSDAEPLQGYKVYVIFTEGEDLYAREAKEGGPAAIICRRRLKSFKGYYNPRCDVISPFDEREFPVKADGRFPLTLEYNFSRTQLQRAPWIDEHLKSLVKSWEVR